MKKLFAGFMCLLLTATVLTGCGSSSRDTSLIRVAVGGDVELLDPAIVDDSITANVLTQMYEGLYTLDVDGNVIPQLAEGAPTVSEDGLVYTIKFKSGVKWSDGKDLKASDFVYAWKRAAAIGGADAYYSMFISQYIAGAIDGTTDENAFANMADTFGAKAIDDTTIEITLKAPCAYFGSLLTNTVFYPTREDVVGKNPTKSTWADKTDNPTNGAFRATAINSKDEIVLEKNEDYRDVKDVKIEKMSFKVMADSEAQTSAFKTGEIDYATAVNPSTIYEDEELNSQLYLMDPFVCNYYVLLNAGDEAKREELKDPEIRKAISYAINRKNVVKATGYGDAASPLYGFVPFGIPGANGDFREEGGDYTKYDFDAAKAIMEAKGYSKDNMLKLEYKYNDLPMHKDVAQAMQADLKKIYVDVQLTKTEKEAFFNARDAGDFEMARHAMTGDFLDPMAYLSMYVGDTTAGNTVDDKTFESMVNTANANPDKTARMLGLGEAEKYLVEAQNYIVPLFTYVDPILKAKELKGVLSSPEGHWKLYKAYYEE